MTTNEKITRGQVVEFTTSHPSACGVIVRGYVTDPGASDGVWPRNPTVHVPGLGGVELLRAWWGNRVRVVPCLFGLDTVPSAFLASSEGAR